MPNELAIAETAPSVAETAPTDAAFTLSGDQDNPPLNMLDPTSSDVTAVDESASSASILHPSAPPAGMILDAPGTFRGAVGVPADVMGAEVIELVQRKLGLAAEDQRLTDKYSVLAHTAQVLDPVADPLGVRPMLRLEATDPLSVLLKRKGLEDVHDRDMAGRTALHHAAYEGNLAQVLFT